MPYPPGDTFTIRDGGGLGLATTGDALPLVIGVTSAGVSDTLYQHNDQNQLKTDLGYGPGVEQALAAMQSAGAVLTLKTQASTAGTSSAVVKTAASTSTGTITLAGAPRDTYRGILAITKTGAAGVARFKYTLDGGYTYSEDILVPSGGTFAIPNTNITVTFVPGAGPIIHEIGDSHAWTSTAPLYTTANLSAAITALLAQIGTRKIRRIILAGKHATAAGAATMAAALDTHLTTLEGKFYFARALMDAGEDTTANVITSMGSFADQRVGVVYGNADVIALNPFAGMGVARCPALLPVGERFAGADLSENLGRKRSGTLRGVRSITHDERVATAFTAADKVITLRTYQGQSGFYVTNGYLKSPTGSDFLYVDFGTLIDEVCEIVHAKQEEWLLSKVRFLTGDNSGFIDPRDADRINQDIRGELRARIMDVPNIEGYLGHASAVGYAVNELVDIVTTRTLRSTSNVAPLIPIEGFDASIGLARQVA